MKTNMARHQRLPRRNCLSKRSPTEVTFGLSPRHGIHNAREAHAWLPSLRRKHEAFEVLTDVAGEWPVPFCSETVRRVVVE